MTPEIKAGDRLVIKSTGKAWTVAHVRTNGSVRVTRKSLVTGQLFEETWAAIPLRRSLSAGSLIHEPAQAVTA